MTINLLTEVERKAIIDKLVEVDTRQYFHIAIGEGAGEAGQIRKNIRKLYNTWDDPKLLSVRIV